MESAKIYPLNISHFEGSAAVVARATPPKPKLLDQVRQAIRRRHYSDRTEKVYVHWIKRFIFFHNKRHPLEMAESEIAPVSFQFGDGGTSQRIHAEPSA